MIKRERPRDLRQSLFVGAVNQPILLAVVSILSGLPISQAIASEVDAAGYYELRCASCHGVNGEGTRDKSPSLAPPLRGNPLVINAPVELLIGIIRHGRGGQQRVYDDAYPNMPAFDAGLVPDPAGLANYLKTVLQQEPKSAEESDATPQPPDEDVGTPGDAATRSETSPVGPRHADEAGNGELQAAIDIRVSR